MSAMKLFHRILLAGVAVIAMLPHDSSALEWESIGPDGGRVDGFAQSQANPERLYLLVYRQGVWRSENRGEDWQRVDIGLPPYQVHSAIAVSQFDEDIVIVGPRSGNSIFRSTDGGIDWSAITVSTDLGLIKDIEFDPLSPRNVLLTADQNGSVYRSTDTGQTWTISSAGFTGTPAQIAFHPTVPGIILVGSFNGMFRSTDAGATWTSSDIDGNVMAPRVSFCRTTPARVWALSFPQRLIRSEDGGLSFVAVGTPKYMDYLDWTAVAAHPKNPNHLLVGFNTWFCSSDCVQFGSVSKSTNAGISWGSFFTPTGDYSWSEYVTGLEFDHSEESIAYYSLGDGAGAIPFGFYRSTDQGNTWNLGMTGIRGQPIGGVDHDGTGKVYARSSGGDGWWAAPAAGGEWSELSDSQLGLYSWTDLRVSRTIPGLIEELGGFSSSDSFNGIYRRSTDGGMSWSSSDFPVSGFATPGTAVVSDDLNGQTVYVWVEETFETIVCRSTDGGTTFQSVHVGGSYTVDAAIDPFDPQKVFSIEGQPAGRVKLTTDGGVTWELRSDGLPSARGIKLLMDPSNPERLAAVYRTAGVFETQNAGVSWNAIPLQGYNAEAVVDADWDPASERFFLAIENGGVFITGVGFLSQGLATSSPTSVTYEPISKKLLLGTQYASVSLLDVGSAVGTPFNAIPPGLDLAIHARPNPSRGQFDFDVHVGEEGTARITIVDVRGRRVAVPFEGRLDQGRHSIHWQGDAKDRIVPGIYFARIDAAGRSATTRIVLLGN